MCRMASIRIPAFLVGHEIKVPKKISAPPAVCDTHGALAVQQCQVNCADMGGYKQLAL